MAKPIASQKLTTKAVKAPAEPVEPAEPAAPTTGSTSPRASDAGKTPTKVTEAETRPDDLPSSQRPPTGSTGEPAPTARIDAAFGKSDPATGGVSKVEERNGRPGEKPSAEDVLNDAQATIADARGGSRGDALAAGVPGVHEGRSGFGSLRDDAAQGDGTTGIAEQGTGAISTKPDAGPSPDLVDLTGTTVPFTGLLKDGAISKTEQFNLEQQARSADMAEAQRLAAEDAKTPPPAEEKKPPPPPAEGKASIPDEERFDPNSTGGQIAESLRASTAPRGGGGDGATDPVDSGDLATGGRTGLVPDQQDTLLGGDNRGGENVGGGGGGGAVPGPNTGTIDPVEGDDVGGGGGRESDPFADANQPGPDFDFNTPTSEDVDDDPAAPFVLDQPRSAVVGRAAEGLSRADDDNDDLNEPD